MKYLKIALLLLLPSCFWQCGPSEWDVTLYAQKIEGTSKILYKYDAWGGRDSNVSGLVIMDSTETFEVVVDDRLPIKLLDGSPNRNYISGIEFTSHFDEDTTTVYTPVDNNTLKEQGITIKSTKYNHSGYNRRSMGGWDYSFESFKETRDSLFFYNLDAARDMEHKYLDVLKLKKGNVTISQGKTKEIVKIEITDIVFSKSNKEILSAKIYSLTPKKSLKSDAFSDHGIFKEVFIEKKP